MIFMSIRQLIYCAVLCVLFTLEIKPKTQLISVQKQCASCTINLCKFQNYKPSIFQAADKFILSSPATTSTTAQIGLKYSNKLILEINGIPNHFKSMQKIEIVDNIILSSDYYNLKWPQPSKSYSIWIRAEERERTLKPQPNPRHFSIIIRLDW